MNRDKSEKKRCVVIGGAEIRNYEAVRSYLDPEKDFYIFCDCGLDHAPGLRVSPDIIVGDFDSHAAPAEGEFSGAEVIALSHFKDDTDTEHAIRVAEERGFKDFLLLGAIGGRFDHSLGNVALLNSLFSDGCRAVAADDWSELEIVGSEPAEISDSFAYFSVVPVTGTARGVYEENALYPLSGAVITSETSLGISNEPLPGNTARVWAEEGRLLLVRVRR